MQFFVPLIKKRIYINEISVWVNKTVIKYIDFLFSLLLFVKCLSYFTSKVYCLDFQTKLMDSQVQVEGRLLDIVTDEWRKEK